MKLPRLAPCLVALLASFPLACAPGARRARPAVPPGSAAAGDATDASLEARAALLMLEDRKLFEPMILESMLEKEPREREELAVALGRIGDRRGRAMLQGLLVDAEPEVRRAAAFSLGILGDPASAPALLRAVADADAETGGLAVEALGRLKSPLAGVRTALGALAPAEAWRRLAPFLFRFDEPAMVDATREALASGDPEVRRGAAYALGRTARPEGQGLLRGLVADPDARIRAMAARGLGMAGELEDLGRLRDLAASAAGGDDSPRIQAILAGARILERTHALPPLEWGDVLAAALADPRPGVRAAALQAAGRFLPNPALESAVIAKADAGEPREQELALVALATGGSSAAKERVARAALSDRVALRVAAVEAASDSGDARLLARLATDGSGTVRAAALEGEIGLDGAKAGDLALAALDDGDAAVRATALDALAASPVAPVARLERAFEAARGDDLEDARVAAVGAIAARGRAAAADRTAALDALARAAENPDALVRRAAAKGLVALGEPEADTGPVETGHDLAFYRDVAAQTARPREVEMTTERGVVRLRLDCPIAPLTCLSFLHLANLGFFDGLAFHRVVPDFVVQGGDPRGDGWGGPGYTLRDELNRLRYSRGVLGMALSGPDTGGSQFFLTLSPQPHLDGGYTAFGEVESGLEVLDEIRQGDRIRSIREIAGRPER